MREGNKEALEMKKWEDVCEVRETVRRERKLEALSKTYEDKRGRLRVSER